MSWMYFVPAGGIMLVFVAILIYQLVIKKWLVNRRKKKSEKVELDEPEVQPPTPPPNIDKGLIKRSFKLAKTDLRRRSVRGSQYDIPWYILAGRQAAGKSTLVASLSDAPSVSQSLARVGKKSGLEWAFLDGGVVLDVHGWYLEEPGDGGAKATGWGRIMRRLNKARKLRPLDGVILTIPAADLMSRGPSAAAERLVWTEQVQERLQALQRRLGVRTPMYIIITKCSELKGFPEFVRQVPDNFRDDMLGWSNPYSLDATYREDWMDEAYTTVAASLAETQLALMTQEGAEMPAREAFYLVRSQLTATKQPLATMIAPLFKSSVYLEPFMLRGVYFVGDDGSSATAADDIPAGEDAGPQLAFTRRLFSTKIFPEAGLLRLGTRAVARRMRFKRIMQGLVLLGCGIAATGIVLAGQNLRSATTSLRPVLTSMSGSNTPNEGGPADVRYSRTETLRLLDHMAELNHGQLESFFLPFSYGSDIDRRIQKSVTIGWERVIFPAFQAELDRLIRQQLMDKTTAESQRSVGQEIAQTAAFAGLRKRVDALQQAADLMRQFDSFIASEDRQLADANSLSEALFGKSLSAGFRLNAEYHREALQAAAGQPFDAVPYRRQADKVASDLMAAMYHSAFDASLLTTALRTVGIATADFMGDPTSGPLKSENLRHARGVVTAINEAQAQARRSRLPMLVADAYKPPTELVTLFADISETPFFNDDLTTRLAEDGGKLFSQAKLSLDNNMLYESDNQTPLLEKRVWLSNFRL
ncbi:MAG: type VI secretion system protein ImpL, partial [Myxococcota bacterium]